MEFKAEGAWRNACGVTISTDRVSELADLSGSMDSPDSPSNLAIIATSELHFGLGRMYQTQREMAKSSKKVVRVFRVREDALQWLEEIIKTPSMIA